MKVVIIEGPDNTGKTTVIHELMEKYDNIYYMHATKPETADPIECALRQKEYFASMVEKVKKISEMRSHTDLVILDRSWVGEYVYGCLYRGNGDKFVKDMIYECYRNLSHISSGLGFIDFSTILYTASPEFCASNDDGKSISNGRVEEIENEVTRFEDIIKSDYVIGKKCIINVEEDGVFKSKEDILNMTMNVINDSRDTNNETGLLYIDGELSKEETDDDIEQVTTVDYEKEEN